MHVQAASVNVPEKLPECPVKFIRGILADSQGAIWAVGERESIYRLDVKNGAYEKSWVNVNYSSSFPRKANFTCIAEDRQGRVWVGWGRTIAAWPFSMGRDGKCMTAATP